VGTLLFWRQNRDSPAFAYRSFEEAPAAQRPPAELVLDGQQRLTSLYQALTGTGDERYYFKLDEFVDARRLVVLEVHEIDFEKAILIQPVSSRKRQETTFEQKESYFAISQIEQFDEWLDSYAEELSEGSRDKERHVKQIFRRVRDRYLIPLRSYGFPLVSLPEATPLEAVCTIFETLNRTGKQLGVFELLTARFYPKGVNLRTLWQEALESYSVLEDFKIDPYSVLQAICLRAHNSAQRADVLKKLERSVPRARIQQYFWCTVFSGNFDQGANSQAGADYARLKGWLLDENQVAPEAIANFNVTTSSIRSATTRRKALYTGLLCLTVTGKAQDFHTGQTMTSSRVRETKIDSHHLYPKAYITREKIKESSELILNRVLIDADTNRIIRDKAPSIYLAEMADTHGLEKLETVLLSHAVPYSADGVLERNDYTGFLNERLELIVELIESVTERPIVRDV
jgi:hypothetical protein